MITRQVGVLLAGCDTLAMLGGFVRSDLTFPIDNFAAWPTNGEKGRNEHSRLTAIDTKNPLLHGPVSATSTG